MDPVVVYFQASQGGQGECHVMAVSQNRRVLDYAAEPLKGDREIVMDAVSQDLHAIKLSCYRASQDKQGSCQGGCGTEWRRIIICCRASHKANREIVMTAVP